MAAPTTTRRSIAAESDAETETETEADVEEGEETTDSSGDDIIVA